MQINDDPQTASILTKMETIPITHGHITSPTYHHISFTCGICTGEVAATVAEFFGIPLQKLIEHGRKEKLARARQIAMSLAYKFTADSQQEVADFFNRHHTTIAYACTAIEDQASYDDKLRKQIELIEQRLGRPNIGRVVT